MQQTSTDLEQIPGTWGTVLSDEIQKPYFRNLVEFVENDRRAHTIFPPQGEVYTALALTPFEKVRVVLLGQDPYPTAGHAHGLCFSVKVGVKQPASLRNIFKELESDLGCSIPNHGFLESWASQGMLMLNAVLTVREGEPNSHAAKGWEEFTDAIIKALNDREQPVVFVLWGNYAQKKGKLIDLNKHTVLKSAHPSPLSVKKFSGSKPFSSINAALEKYSYPPIDWQLDSAL
jgi:uracil-DNA glycosylase